jgi:hypothetical protein
MEVTDNGRSWNGVTGGTLMINRAESEFIRDIFHLDLNLPGTISETHKLLNTSFHRGDKTMTGSGILHGFMDCHVEYYVPACKAGDACKHLLQNSWEMPYAGEVIANYAHYHTGGISMASAFGKQTVCHNKPTYGKYKGGEQLTGISECRTGLPDRNTGQVFQPIPFKKGDRSDVGMLYQQDDKPHYGVMGYSVLFVHRADAIKEMRNRSIDFQELWDEARRSKRFQQIQCRVCGFLSTGWSMRGARSALENECSLLPEGSFQSSCMEVVSVVEKRMLESDGLALETNAICGWLCGMGRGSAPFFV